MSAPAALPPGGQDIIGKFEELNQQALALNLEIAKKQMIMAAIQKLAGR